MKKVIESKYFFLVLFVSLYLTIRLLLNVYFTFNKEYTILFIYLIVVNLIWFLINSFNKIKKWYDVELILLITSFFTEVLSRFFHWFVFLNDFLLVLCGLIIKLQSFYLLFYIPQFLKKIEKEK